jgi:hypothetical protein
MNNPKIKVVFSLLLFISLIVSLVFENGEIVVGLLCGFTLSENFVYYLGKLIRYYKKKAFLIAITFTTLALTTCVVAPYLAMPLIAGVAIHWIIQPEKHYLHIHPKKKKQEEIE